MIENIFDHKIVLEDESVLLRPLVSEDYEHFVAFAISEPEIWKYSLVNPAGEAAMKNYIETAVNNRTNKKDYTFIVFDKSTNEYAGCTRFYDIQQHFQTTQLGYTWYGQKFQRTGLNRHCKFLLLQFAFEEWKMERVELRADANNERSINAMKAIGCTVEGILRSHAPVEGGKRRNSIILSILKDEWFNGGKELLKNKLG
ncbi:MAG: GNAT family N-acetyltransferase [Ferruginibacter sp.]